MLVKVVILFEQPVSSCFIFYDDDSGSEDEEQAAGLTSGASASAEPEGDFDCGADSLFDSD